MKGQPNSTTRSVLGRHCTLYVHLLHLFRSVPKLCVVGSAKEEVKKFHGATVLVVHPLSSDHAPIGFSCCRPTPATQFRLDFPWLMWREPEDALDWSERTGSSATRAFHHRDGTGRKSVEINGNERSRKHAFG